MASRIPRGVSYDRKGKHSEPTAMVFSCVFDHHHVTLESWGDFQGDTPWALLLLQLFRVLPPKERQVHAGMQEGGWIARRDGSEGEPAISSR